MHGSNTAPLAPGGNYLEKRNAHPRMLVAAVAIHAGLLGAILTYNPEIVGLPPKPKPIELIPITKPVEPVEPIKREPQKEPIKADPRPQPPTTTTTTIPTEPTKPWIIAPPPPPQQPGTGTGTESGGAIELTPVIVGASLDPRFARDQQPPYPPSLERLEFEGSVTVKIQIGTDGRVTAVDLVRTDHPLFFSSTRDWALRKWRFRPATRDGVAVATSMTKTVQFKIVRGF